MTRKEETWCSTAGGRRHQTWAQTREKRTAAAGIWQLAALAAGREETPLPVSLGRWRLMHTHTFTNLAALFPVFPARDSRSRSPQAGPHYYYYYRYRWPRRPPGCTPVATLAAPAAPSRAFHLAESRQTLVLHDPATENSGNFGGRSPYGFCR